MTPEDRRLEEARDGGAPWKKWGPYLSDRQWSTVREDYSPGGSAWEYFPHDQARSRAYRWGEDGLGGISDSQQKICFAIALWNGQDPILKERFFGLTGNQGNHGEDVKEYYFFLDSTPTHSYMKFLYKYPQAAYPYQDLIDENARRGPQGMEYELLDTGVFDDNRYFDVFVEYAKADAEDILIQIHVANRAPEAHTLHVLPTLWFRNTWSWDKDSKKPSLKQARSQDNFNAVSTSYPKLNDRWWYCQKSDSKLDSQDGAVQLLFTENETNYERLFGDPNASPYVKDGINDYIVEGKTDAVNPDKVGTKVAANYFLELEAGETKTIKLRLCKDGTLSDPLGDEFDRVFTTRKQEADAFYQSLLPDNCSADLANIMRQAIAGMMWTKQYYLYDVSRWLKGDPTMPKPPDGRDRNRGWGHLGAENILSMPDNWEYPWFAAWDLAFHCLPLAIVDPEFAKHQLDLMTREWYMHPNGQIPAYEWNFGDVNPPVHAWATWRVYKIEEKRLGKGDRAFLERVFQKLLLNFTWWVNRKDEGGNNVFEGGFLGLDNIGVFDRSKPLPTGGYLEQSDGTSWMGMFCLNMLTIALELAKENPVYEDMATKFFEHFLYIADALNHIGEGDTQLWDPDDNFFYDVLNLPDGKQVRLKVRSMVGLIPLFAVMTLEPELLEKMPDFKKRVEWFIKYRTDLKQNVACMEVEGKKARRLLALCYATPEMFEETDKLRLVLEKLLDESEFLSPHGIRALSRYHQDHPYIYYVNGAADRVDYQPAESTTKMFGGNSNWRGPVWMPVNYLIIESLQKYYHYLGDEFKVECPTGSGNMMNLWQVAEEISRRLIGIFAEDSNGKRPVYGGLDAFQNDPHWHDLILFYEYFHGDNGAGLGASHQTGWTGLVAKLIQQTEVYKQKSPD